MLNQVSQWILLAVLLLAGMAHASSYEERRVIVGAKLFHALVVADLDLAEKLDEQERVNLALVYHQDPDAPETALKWLQAKAGSGIQSKAVTNSSVSSRQLLDASAAVPSALFIAEKLPPETLQALISYARTHQLIIYSPFEGDVEAGVFAGVSVEARVRPYLNLSAMSASGLNIKSFFLKIAKTL